MCRKRRRSVGVSSAERWIVSVLFVCHCVIFCALPALAHKVMIFAWVEGDTVHTQSKFSGGKRVRNSTVVVYDTEGNQLLEGKTDENGKFSFKIPRQTSLKVVLKASMGHLAEWTIAAEEITGVAQASERSSPEVSMDAVTEQPASLADQQQPAPMTVGLNREEVQALIDESLDRKLMPVYSKLTEALDRGPRLRDVIGGIGYIFGLVGVALYFSRRGRNK